MCIFDILTLKLLICHWFCVYFVHSDKPSGTAGWDCLGCLGWLGGRWRSGAAEGQKVLNFLGNSGGHFPALYVFQYFLALMNAKYTFVQRKCVRHFEDHPPAQPLICFSLRQNPIRASSVWGINRSARPPPHTKCI